jgi:hypothetical protein
MVSRTKFLAGAGKLVGFHPVSFIFSDLNGSVSTSKG